jgi:hypothetical protein
MVFAVASLFTLGCAEATSVWQDPTADDDWSASIHGHAHTAEWTAEDVAAAFLAAVSAGGAEALAGDGERPAKGRVLVAGSAPPTTKA